MHKPRTLSLGKDYTPNGPQRPLWQDGFCSRAGSYPLGPGLVAHFERCVDADPEAPALVYGDERLSYRQLDQRTNRLAHLLRSRGVGVGDLVGILVERSADLPLAMLAILKAGGAYVPLDPTNPPQRWCTVLEDARPRLLLAHGHLASLLPAHFPGAPELLLLDQEADTLAAAPSTRLTLGVDDSCLAYLLFTSGSTGKPKGVLIHQRAVVRLVLGEPGWPAPRRRIAQFSSAGFDASTLEIWGALLQGGTLIGVMKEHLRSLDAFADLVLSEGIEEYYATPLYFAQLLEARPEVLGQLKLLNLGGDRCDPKLLKYIRDRFDGSLVHGYGPTECTSLATALEIETVDDDEAPVPIGFPLAGTDIAIFDEEQRLVLDDEPGELYLGGDGLSLGYYGRPALTAEKFVPHPHPATPGQRLYRTGDLVRRLPSGALVFLGRVDSQVKIRGYRIEPGEVEKVLLRHAQVREAAVIPRQVGGETRLVAYFVPADAALVPTPAALRDFLKESLPEYMVPAAFMHMGALPRTLGDKIDRRILPPPDAEAFAGGARRPPVTAMENKLALLWSELLGVPEIGLDDDFFQLGGHSLLVGRLASALRKQFEIDLPMGEIFDHPKLEELAARIEFRLQDVGENRAEAVLPPLPPITRLPRDGRVFPLSFPQERVWLIQQLEQGSIAYNFQACLFFRGPLDPRCLAQALTEIVRRHEIFHTGYQLRDGRPAMVIEGPFTVDLPVNDLRALGPAGAITRAEELFETETRQAFDLSHPPLIRWKLYRLEDERWVLLQVEHHFVHDGWSLSVLARELQTLYRAYVAGQSSPLPELEIQFPDFAAWQRREIAGARLDRLKAWWRQQLDGMPHVLELASDRPRPDRPSSRGDSKQLIVPRPLYRDLRAFSRENGTTLYMTMLAAFAVLMQRYGGQTDLAIGSGVANRSQQAQHGMIGMVVNSIVLRCRLDGDPSFRELLARIRRTTIESYEHQDMPFDQLVNELRPERHISRNPIFQVMFSFHDAAVPAFDFGPGLDVRGILRTNHSAKTDLNVIVAPQAEQQVGQKKAAKLDAMINWEYSSELFDRATIKRMIRHYLNLLRSAVDHPDRRISQLQMTSPQEREQLVSLALCQGEYPREASLVGLWRGVVAGSPAAPAVVAGGSSLSYAELDARSTRLAELLVLAGMTPGEWVGIAVERGLDLVVGLLGILKAGGAYVPLDPSYPPERLALMVADTGMRRVLTQTPLEAALPPGLELLALDRLQEALAAPPQGLRLPSVDGGFPAYVVYTSGSTGKPKGVVVPQRAVARLVLGTNYVRLGPGVRVLQAANASFDAITFELWAPLLHGGTVVVVDRETLLSPAGLEAALGRQPVDIAFFTTALFQQLARERPGALGSIGTLLFGGERCEPAAVRAALATGTARIEHVYGPTECTTFALFHPVDAVPEEATSVPIGLPIAHTEAWVLDENLRLCPLGVAGELLLGGDGLALGYHQRPGLTAEKFVPHPFSAVPGARLYRSGDRVRRLPGGEIDFLGRVDHQVKLRGFRIELGEIEAALGRLPEVTSALVLLREDRPGEKRLVAYVVASPGAVVDAEVLRLALRRTLPEFLVPNDLVLLGAFPLNANGKVDRKALPVPERGAASVRRPPETATEVQLATMFRELLALDEVGIDEDFFSLGGHSLLASQLATHVAADLGKKLTLAQIFAASTIREMAELLDAQLAEAQKPIPRRQGPGTEHLVLAAENLDEKALDALLGDLQKE